MRKLLLIAVLLIPACGGGGNTPTPVTQPPAPVAPPPVTQPPAPTVPSVTGSWDSEARRWHFRLQNSGSTVTGQLLGFGNDYYSNPDHSDLAIRGTVSSSGAITFGCIAFGVNFTGQITSSSRMTGTLYDCGGTSCRNYGDNLAKTAN